MVGTIVGVVVFISVVLNVASEAVGGTDPGAGGSSAPVVTEPAASAVPETPDGDYTVTIDGATKVEDYEGKPVLLVDFTFTNNSDKDASFLWTLAPSAFQDGIELETAIILDDTEGIRNALKDIKPGITINVQEAYVLAGTSEVTVEVTELISFDDTIIATKVFNIE